MATKTTKPGTQVILWEQEMKAAAVKQAAGEKVFEGFKKINVQSGFMMIDGEPVKDNTLDVIVLAAVPLNEYYSTAYNPAKPTVPDCYAYGDPKAEDPEEGMAPGDVEDQQSTKCDGCEKNVFGSADTGRGKACKNVRRLLVMTDDSLDNMKDAEERSLSIPVMSVANWAKYVKNVLGDEIGRPYYGVVTTISVKPDPKSQYRMHFAFKELINFDQDLWAAMKAKTEAAMKAIIAPYPKQSDLDANAAAKAPPPKKGGKAAPTTKKKF